MPKCAALCLALLVTAVLVAGDDPEPRPKAVRPREVVVEGLPAGRGSVESPTSIPSEKHLSELVTDKGVRAVILKQVDFRKERLLLFRWHGGGFDRLTPVEGKPGEAAFEFAPATPRRPAIRRNFSPSRPGRRSK
jgi:hypothetical protein